MQPPIAKQARQANSARLRHPRRCVIMISVCTRTAACCKRCVCSGAAQCKHESHAVPLASYPCRQARWCQAWQWLVTELFENATDAHQCKHWPASRSPSCLEATHTSERKSRASLLTCLKSSSSLCRRIHAKPRVSQARSGSAGVPCSCVHGTG